MQLELFHHNPNIQEVTVGHLLAMTSGIDDWSVGMIQDWMYLYGRDDDLSPCDILNMNNKELLCPKPPCEPYWSGTGYILLGFIAQSLRKQSHWTDWNRKSYYPLY